MGRTLDYEFSYGDQITVTPRNYPFSFLHMPSLSHHYAMIGMACVMDDYPLYYDAFNEKGLGIAGLNFVGNAVYFDPKPEKDNIAQFELIPWILGTCASLAEAKESLSRINLISTPFKKNLPLAQLHWIIADASGAITVESTADGLHVYDNPGRRSDKQSAVSNADVLTEQLPASVTETAGQHVFQPARSFYVQPWHGRSWTAGRPLFCFPLCTRGVCKAELDLGKQRNGECQPVFPYFKFCRPAERMLRGGGRKV